jgi:hypothetical protein
MTKTVWTYGLLAGAALSAMMLLNILFIDRIGFDAGVWVGYTTIIAAFLLIFFGVRSYRDNKAGRTISFGRAFVVGVLINLVASACYVAMWQVASTRVAPDFAEKYATHIIEKERSRGATPAEIAKKTEEMQDFQEMYKNPFIKAGMTFLEPFPVGLIVSLMSAGILRRRRDTSSRFTNQVTTGSTA